MQNNPYIGPSTFQKDQGHLFYGRDREARDLIALVASERLVVFYAQSGAGKSSIVNTRLIPSLEEKEYEVLPVGRVGGDAPEDLKIENIYVYNLLHSLEQHDSDPVVLSKLSLSDFLAQLNVDGKGFFYDPGLVNEIVEGDEVEIVRRALVIDQFEELFSTHAEAWEKRDDFFLQLANAMENDPYLWVILVMREDYIASLDPYAHYVENGLRVRYYMERLEREAALKAVTSPVEGIRPYAQGVAEKLIDDLCRITVQKPDGTLDIQPGQYVEPVQLQVVCYELWENLSPEGEKITEKDVQDVGDVNQSLGKFYDRKVKEVAKEKKVKERLIREWIEKKLIAAGGIRNMVMQELKTQPGSLADDVIQALQSDLVRAEKRGGATWYELTHDRMVEPILERNRVWFTDNLSLLQKQAAIWNEQNRQKSLLLRGSALVEMKVWAETHEDELTDTDRDFLDACQKLQLEINKEQEDERQKLVMANKLAETQARSAKIAKRGNIFAGIAVVLVLIVLLFVNRLRIEADIAESEAIKLKDEALTLKADAETAKDKAEAQERIARSGDLILRAIDNADQPDLATLLNIEAYGFNNESSRAQRALLFSLQEFGGLQSFWNLGADQYVLSPDGKTLASLDEGGVTLWDMNSRAKLNPEPINGHFSAVYPSTFSPDGKFFVSASQDSSIVIWAVEDQGPPQALTDPLKEHSAWVDTVAFRPDGSVLASASDDATVILWDMSDPADPNPIGTLRGHNGWIASVAFNSDGTLLASGSSDATVMLWDVSDPENPEKIGEPLATPSNIYCIAISKDDQILAAGSGDGSIMLWDISEPDNPLQFNPIVNDELTYSGVFGMAFSPLDDRMLAVGGGNSINLWDVSDPENPALVGEPITEYSEAGERLSNSYIFSVVFSPDGSTLASSSSGSLILWDVSSPDSPTELGSALVGTSGLPINSISFNPDDGTRLMTGSQDGSVIYWDVTDPNSPVQIGASQKGHPGLTTGMYFTSDGSILVSIGDGGDVLLNAVTHSLLGPGYVMDMGSESKIKVIQYSDHLNNENVIEISGTTDAGEDVTAKVQGTFSSISPTGQTLVYTTLDKNGKSNINLWDLPSGKPIKTDIPGDYLAFSPDGKIFAYQTVDDEENRSINLIDTASGSLLVEKIQGDLIAFTPDSKILLYMTVDENLEFFINGWDITTKKPTSLYVQGIYQATSMDGKSLVIRTQDDQGNYLLGLVDINTGENIGKAFKASSFDAGEPFNVFLADTIVFYQSYNPETGYSDVYLHDTVTGQTVSEPTYANTLTQSPDEKVLVYDTFDLDTGIGFINFLDLTTGLSLGEPATGTFNMFVPGEDVLVYNFYDSSSGSNFVALLDMSTGLTIGLPQAGDFYSLSPDNKVLAYQSYDSFLGEYFINLLDMTTGLTIGSTPGGASFIGFSHDGRSLIYQRYDSDRFSDVIGLLDATTGRIISETIVKGFNPLLQPNGNLLTTTGENGLVYFWDLSKTSALGTVIDHSVEPVDSIALAPDGKTTAIVSESGIALGSQKPFNHHVGGVTSVIFSPDGKTLLSVGEDGKSVLWDLADRSILWGPVPGEGRGFSPDGRTVVLVDGQNNTTRFVDVATSNLKGNPIAGTGLTFSPDGTLVAVSDFNNNQSTLWDLNTLGRIGDPLPGIEVAFSASGKFLVTTNNIDENFTAWSLTDSKIESIKDLTDVPGAWGSLVPGGENLLVFHDYFYNDEDNVDENVVLWNLTARSKRTVNSYLYRNDVRFSPRGKYLLTSDGYAMLLMDLNTLEQLDIPIQGWNSVFSPDEKLLAINDENNFFLWDLTEKLQLEIPIEGYDPVFSPNGRFLAITVSKNDVASTVLWDLATGEDHPLAGVGAVFTSDSKFFANSGTVFDLQTLKPILEDEAGGFSVENMGNTLAIYGSKGTLLWDIAANKALGQALSGGHTGKITNAVFSPDGQILASVASDGVILSNLEGKQLGDPLPGSAISFSPDGKIIAVGGEFNNETDLWDVTDNNSYQPVLEDPLTGIGGTFSPDGKILKTSDVENTMTLLWDASTWEQIGEPIPGVYSFFSVDGDHLAVISTVNTQTGSITTISIWDLKSYVEVGKIKLENPCSSDSSCNIVAFSSDGKYLAYNEAVDNQGTAGAYTYLWNLEKWEPVKLGARIQTPGGINDLSFIFEAVSEKYLLIIEDTTSSFTIWEAPAGLQISEPVLGDFLAQTSVEGRNTLLYIEGRTHDVMQWTYVPEDWADQMCEKVGRNFTPDEWTQIFSDAYPYRKTCEKWP